MVSLNELRPFEVVVGGTFGPLHDGHRELLERALSTGNTIVGITSDTFARESRNHSRYVPSFQARRTRVRDELVHLSRKYGSEFAISKIEDPFSLSLELENLKYIVVTPKDGAHETAKQLNEKREKRGMAALEILEADVAIAEDGGPISSTRIVNMEIDEHGTLIDG